MEERSVRSPEVRSALDELIARLEKATGPDREVDYAILFLVDRERFEYCDRKYRETMQRARDNGLTNRDEACHRDGFSSTPSYTRSMDAALTLVPEGCDFYFEVEQVMGGFCNYLFITDGGSLAPSHNLRGKGGKLHPTWREAVDALPGEITATALKARPTTADRVIAPNGPHDGTSPDTPSPPRETEGRT